MGYERLPPFCTEAKEQRELQEVLQHRLSVIERAISSKPLLVY
jgi:hypothetical protein